MADLDMQNNANGANNAPILPKTSSPWDEPLPQEKPKEKVIGNLTAITPPVESKPFTLPENIENKTMPAILQASDLVKTSITAPAMPKTEPEPIQPENKEDIEAANPVLSATRDLPAPVSPTPISTSTTEAPISAPITSDSMTLPGESNPIEPVTLSPSVTPANLNMAGETPFRQSITTDIRPARQGFSLLSTASIPPSPPTANLVDAPIAPSTPLVPPTPASGNGATNSSVLTEPSSSTPATAQIPVSSEEIPVSMPKKKRLAALFAGLRRRDASQALPATTSADANQQTAMPGPQSKFKRILSLSACGIVVLLALAIFLTEYGVFSIGLEKFYNVIGVEKLWGGLPATSEKALGRSFIAMQEHPDFKVTGTISFTLDKTMKNTITTPLVSESTALQIFTAKPIKAILAVDTTDSDDSDFIDDTSDSMDSSDDSSDDVATASLDSTDSDTDSLITTDDSSSDDSDSVSVTTDQSSEASYKDTTTTRTFTANIAGNFSANGNSAVINIKKPVGKSPEIDLKNYQDKLWVRSDQINFDTKAVAGKWLPYTLRNLSSKSAGNEFFSVDANKGLSISGSRTATEKMNSTLTYRYSLQNVEIGDSLSTLGISSDSIQSVSGTVWIGIKDKLVRRLDLRVVGSPSSPMIQLNLSLNFSDYDISNNFTAPAATDLVDTTTPVAAAPVTPATTPTYPNDTTRKNDLAAIKAALEGYKAVYKTYPVAKTAINLNNTTNTLAQKLVPKYLSALPKDPLDASGWVYTYQSATGKTFTLSARLENTSDSAGKQSGANYLYFLYNQ